MTVYVCRGWGVLPEGWGGGNHIRLFLTIKTTTTILRNLFAFFDKPFPGSPPGLTMSVHAFKEVKTKSWSGENVLLENLAKECFDHDVCWQQMWKNLILQFLVKFFHQIYVCVACSSHI